MSLPLKKIYIDTRYRTSDSISTSSFKIELPFTVELPDPCSFSLTDISVEHSWYSVEQDINDKMYLQLTNLVGNQYKSITLPAKNYTGDTLTTALSTLLNTLGDFIVSYDPNTNTMTIKTIIAQFRILTDEDAKTIPTWQPGAPADPLNPIRATIS